MLRKDHSLGVKGDNPITLHEIVMQSVLHLHSTQSRQRAAFSLLELLAVVTIMGIIAAIAIPRIGNQAFEARKQACNVNKGNIDVQAQIFYQKWGRFPAANLSDMGTDTNQFPEGLPVCPVDSTSYTFDSSTQRVSGHRH